MTLMTPTIIAIIAILGICILWGVNQRQHWKTEKRCDLFEKRWEQCEEERRDFCQRIERVEEATGLGGK
jgi:hypothetical protein